MAFNINDFSVEIILHIFEYCDIVCLCRLRQCCRRFNLIINEHKIPVEEYKALVTNQKKESIRNRSFYILNGYEKWRISHNWKIGRYKACKLLKQRKKFMPWTHLDSKFFWISYGKYVKGYRRSACNGLAEHTPAYNLNSTNNEEIVRFTIKDRHVISGLRNGGLWIYSLIDNKIIVNCSQSHYADVTDVDLSKDIFVTSSVDRSFSVWKLDADAVNEHPRPIHNKIVYDKIWSIEMSPSRSSIAIGTAGFNGVTPFQIYDLESVEPYSIRRQVHANGAGTLDLHWEDDNTIITCGYDTYLRKWDMRIGNCVQMWEDPHDSALYCIASDDLYSLMVGTISYGRVVLWDQRVHTKYVQFYYACNTSCLNTSSPVYSVAFDSCQLFTALDRCTVCLDFTNYRGKVRNYKY